MLPLGHFCLVWIQSNLLLNVALSANDKKVGKKVVIFIFNLKDVNNTQQEKMARGTWPFNGSERNLYDKA